MREKTVLKRCLALLLAFALVVTGLTIPKNDAMVAEASDTTESATNIVGDTTADDTTAEAKIGEAYFTTFEKAVAEANKADGVTIELLNNVKVDAAVELTKKVTIDGQKVDGERYTIESTVTGSTAMFKIMVAGVVELKNVDIVYRGTNIVIRYESDYAGADVRLTNVDITSTGNVTWALINMNVSGTALTKLTLDTVNIDMNATTNLDGGRAIIRTGNGGNKVYIETTNSTLDASGAYGRHGISVTSGTDAEINLTDTNIYTRNALPIYDYTGSATIDKVRCSMSIADTTNLMHVEADGDRVAFTATYTEEGAIPVAQIGNTLYTDFASAISAATVGAKIDLLADVTVGTKDQGNSTTGQVVINKNIVIDGNQHTMTTYAKHTFNIQSSTITFKNLIWISAQVQGFLQVNSAATVTMTDVTVEAKSTSTAATLYQYGLINVPDSAGRVVTLNLTRVDVTMETGTAYSSDNHGVIRTGNSVTTKDTVNITLDDCEWNLKDAPYRKAIAIMKGTTANVSIINSIIETDGTTEAGQPIYINDLTTTYGTVKVEKKNCTLTNETYEAQIGNTLYKKFCDDVADDTTTEENEKEDSALTVANTATEDVTVELLKDVTITAVKYFNSTSGVVTVDGNQHVLTRTGGNLFRVDGSKNVTLKNMTITHGTSGSVVQIRLQGTTEPVTVTVENVDITTASAGRIFNIMQDANLILNNVDVTMTASSAASANASAVIGTGNDSDATDNAGTKTVDITMNGCDFNTTGASVRYGILILSKTTATINITDSTIQTCDVEPIKDLSGTATVNAEGYTYGSDGMDAQIGLTGYTTLAKAISAAKDSTADVTIELLKNVETSTCEIYSENGQGITIDGNGYTVTTSGSGNNAFVIRGSADGTGTYEFKNMNVIHKKPGVLVQLNVKEVTTTDEEGTETKAITHTTKNATVKLTDMNISNADNGGYLYGLITTIPSGSDANMTLDLNNVDVTMKFDSDTLGTESSNAAIIRTGNDGTKTVNINLADCNFDTTEAANIRGIRVLKSATANIVLENTNITTKNIAPIEANDAATASTITMTGECTFDAETEEFKNAPIKGYDAQVGNVVYLNFKDALAVANAVADDVTIELLQDFTTTGLQEFKNPNETASITVDGKGYTVKTQAASATANQNAFKITNAYASDSITFKNMYITHTSTRAAFQNQATGVTVTLDNVEINTAETVTYEFGIINMEKESNLVLNDVKVFLKATDKDTDVATEIVRDTGAHAIIRTGNADEKTVNITMTNCTLDASGAYNRHGILIMNKTTAKVTIIDSTITTLDAAPIYNNSGITDTTITKSGDWKLTCQEYQAQIGNDMYLRAFEDIAEDTATEETEYVASAFTVSQTSTNDVTIEVLQDITLTAAIANFANTAGYSLTVDGNNHTLTTPNSDIHAITIAQYGSTVAMKNMKLDHDADKCLFVISKAGVSFQLEDVVVDATDGVNKWCVINTDYTDTTATTTLDFTRVKIDLDVDTSAASQRAIIRTGNDNNAKYVTINLTDCVLDASGASGRHGISVMNATTATINLKGGSIKTDDTYAIYVKKEEGLESFTMDNTLLTSDTAFYAINPIYNSDGHEVSGKSYTDLQSYRGEGYVDSSYTSNGGSYYYAAKPDGVGMRSDMPIYQVPSDITAGNVFGGWYVDEDLSDALKIDVDEDGNITNEVEGVTEAYAKLVPDHVMSVKAQISKNLIDGDDTNDSTGTIRFVTTTDSLDYHELGFKYSVVAADGTPIMNGIKSSSKVYKEIYALEENGGTMNYHPSIFCTESEYFKTLIIEGVPKAYFDANITVQPFWITYDGTIVWGEEVTKTVQQGIDSTGWQLDNTTSGYTHRVILVSDIHYTTELSQNDYNTTYSTQLAANGGKGASIASGTMLGYTQAQKIQAVLDDISAFAATGRKLDSVLVLGDLTTDDYGYRGLVDNGFLDDFKTDFMDKISASYGSCYALPGNHDSHTTNVWNQLLGTTLGRQYYVEIGDAVFVMLDTFAVTGTDTSDVASAVSDTNGNAIDASGANYSGVDVEWLSEVLKEIDDDKTIFLCSHKYNADTTLDAGFTDLVNSDARIVCMFEAHTHKYAVSSVTDSCKLINVGTYSYKSNALGETTFNSYNTFDEAYAWGFQVLEWNDNEVRTYHVRNARTYTGYEGEDSTSGENKTYEYPGVIENMVTIKLNK